MIRGISGRGPSLALLLAAVQSNFSYHVDGLEPRPLVCAPFTTEAIPARAIPFAKPHPYGDGLTFYGLERKFAVAPVAQSKAARRKGSIYEGLMDWLDLGPNAALKNGQYIAAISPESHPKPGRGRTISKTTASNEIRGLVKLGLLTRDHFIYRLSPWVVQTLKKSGRGAFAVLEGPLDRHRLPSSLAAIKEVVEGVRLGRIPAAAGVFGVGARLHDTLALYERFQVVHRATIDVTRVITSFERMRVVSVGYKSPFAPLSAEKNKYVQQVWVAGQILGTTGFGDCQGLLIAAIENGRAHAGAILHQGVQRNLWRDDHDADVKRLAREILFLIRRVSVVSSDQVLLVSYYREAEKDVLEDLAKNLRTDPRVKHVRMLFISRPEGYSTLVGTPEGIGLRNPMTSRTFEDAVLTWRDITRLLGRRRVVFVKQSELPAPKPPRGSRRTATAA